MKMLPMKKTTNKPTNKVKVQVKGKTVKAVVEKEILTVMPEIALEDDDAAEVKHDELDPEILEALNAKKKQAKKANKFVDYIPELERGDDELGGLDDGAF